MIFVYNQIGYNNNNNNNKTYISRSVSQCEWPVQHVLPDIVIYVHIGLFYSLQFTFEIKHLNHNHYSVSTCVQTTS